LTGLARNQAAVAGEPNSDALPLSALKAIFRRPAGPPPYPQDNPPTPEKIALGERLFHERRLSADGTIACASCHNPQHAYSDGRRRARGISGVDRPRHTPKLWNLAWSKSFYWDGRAPTLETQARVPIEHPDEMGFQLGAATERLKTGGYSEAFAAAFPADPRVTADDLTKAIAAFVRTLVSPETRFDRWIEGDESALSAREIEGFRIFSGKGRCLGCHGGWRFTDDRFYDIGLASADAGRGGLAGTNAEPHSFKTPSLRELRWSAPYMHDGSLDTLEAVLRHYGGRLIKRASLAPELKRGIKLTPAERRDLLAFLLTLSSDRPPATSLP
jgi:cytochrome c peroxidase